MRPLPWARQVKLVRTCIEEGISLDEALTSEGLGRDDLRYATLGRTGMAIGGQYVPFENLEQCQQQIPLVSFFSGAGGLDLGFEAAGFRTEVMIEVNELFCRTLRKNWPGRCVLGPPNHSGDVSRHDELYDALRREGISPEFEGVFVGGPPCQPFSIAANQRFARGDGFKRIGFSDQARGNLLFDYVDLIERFRPRAFVVENVPGLGQIDGGEQLKSLLQRLVRAGYVVPGPSILEVKDYGVPQRRRRLFICGYRGRPAPLMLVRSEEIPSVWDALSDPVDALPNHETRRHRPESIDRYMRIEVGKREARGRVDRLDPTQPSKTVIAGGTGGGGRSHLHPYIPRTLSPRECARLQTFPDSHLFEGPIARQFTQVGNAVPPKLAYALATAIRVSWFDHARGREVERKEAG